MLQQARLLDLLLALRRRLRLQRDHLVGYGRQDELACLALAQAQDADPASVVRLRLGKLLFQGLQQSLGFRV